MKPFFVSALTSYALGSLSRQMWRSADRVATDKKAQEQVFRAFNRLAGVERDRKDEVVKKFGDCTRAGSIASGGASLVFAIRAIFKLF